MASFSLHAEDVFPNGTTLSAVKRSNYAINQLPPTSNVGSVDATAVVTSGIATFTGLADDTAYFATGTVSGSFKVIHFRTPVSSATGRTATIYGLTADTNALTATTTLTTAAGSDGSSLAVPIGASDILLIEHYILIDAANITMDAKLGIIVPAGATALWGFTSSAGPGSQSSWTPPTGAGNAPNGMATETGSVVVGVVASPPYTGVQLAGFYYGGGTAGSVNLQFAQNTSDPGALKIHRGSCARAFKVN